MLERLLDRLSPAATSVHKMRGIRGIPVIVSGSLVESPAVLAAIEECGGRIVGDDLCTGYRHMMPVCGQGSDPVKRLVDRLCRRYPCPARSRAEDRGRQLIGLMKDSAAQGIVFLTQKFCTPHLADYPRIFSMLKKNGYPSLLLEFDEIWQVDGQMKTRLDAFFEIIDR
jgi:benzoyl-CoA reductase/2-hydroxyglutaryl-CoA dehydratase subunit BcrC/BadD/HgdB